MSITTMKRPVQAVPDGHLRCRLARVLFDVELDLQAIASAALANGERSEQVKP